LVVKKGSKIRPSASGAMPVPLSSIWISTPSESGRVATRSVPPWRHRIAGIDEQIEEGTLEPLPLGVYRRRPGEIAHDRDAAFACGLGDQA
jgi:hypothetical protein